jgi:hypothetical protein
MLVSSKHNFLFLRVPKTGSTSAVFYLLDSGLIDDNDLYGNKTAKKVKGLIAQVSPEMGNSVIKDETAITKFSHQKHKNIISDYPFLANYTSIATVRNPVNKIVSAALMLNNKSDERQLNENIEFILSSTGIFSVPQSEFVGDDTILWPTEYLKSNIESFILNKNGRVRGEWRCRSNGSEGYISMISPENMKQIYKMYSNDFDLWEDAMKKKSESKAHNPEAA